MRYRLLLSLFGLLVGGCSSCGSGQWDPRSPIEVPKTGADEARTRFEEARARFEKDDLTVEKEFQAIAREFPDDPIAAHAILYAGMSAHRRGDHADAHARLTPLAADARAEEAVRTRARFYLGLSAAYLQKYAEARWDPLESTCRHASLSIL